MIRSIEQLKAWFKKGAYPTAEQFGEWLESFFHKNDKIPVNSVDQLPEYLADKFDRAIGERLEEMQYVLDQAFNQHKDENQVDFENLNTALSNETSRATEVENSLGARVDTEVARATAAEDALGARVDAEIARATDAENALGVRIDTLPLATTETNGLMSAADKQRIGNKPFLMTFFIKTTVPDKKKLHINLGPDFRSIRITVVGSYWYGQGRIEKIYNQEWVSTSSIVNGKVAALMPFRGSGVDAIYLSDMSIEQGEFFVDVVCKSTRFEDHMNLKIMVELINAENTANPRPEPVVTIVDATPQELAKSNIDEYDPAIETARATEAESALGTRIDNEASRATFTEDALATRIQMAEDSLGARIDNEASRATTAENALSGRIDNNFSIIEALGQKTSSLENDIGWEIVRSKDVDNDLSTRIQSLEAGGGGTPNIPIATVSNDGLMSAADRIAYPANRRQSVCAFSDFDIPVGYKLRISTPLGSLTEGHVYELNVSSGGYMIHGGLTKKTTWLDSLDGKSYGFVPFCEDYTAMYLYVSNAIVTNNNMVCFDIINRFPAGTISASGEVCGLLPGKVFTMSLMTSTAAERALYNANEASSIVATTIAAPTNVMAYPPDRNLSVCVLNHEIPFNKKLTIKTPLEAVDDTFNFETEIASCSETYQVCNGLIKKSMGYDVINYYFWNKVTFCAGYTSLLLYASDVYCLDDGWTVCIDIINRYYDPVIARGEIRCLSAGKQFTIETADATRGEREKDNYLEYLPY